MVTSSTVHKFSTFLNVKKEKNLRENIGFLKKKQKKQKLPLVEPVLLRYNRKLRIHYKYIKQNLNKKS